MDFNYEEAQDLFNYFGGDEEAGITVVELTGNEGHSGPGMYAYSTEYPEEGCILLGKGKSVNVVLTDDEMKVIEPCEKEIKHGLDPYWKVCPWCGRKIQEGEYLPSGRLNHRVFFQNISDAINKLKR